MRILFGVSLALAAASAGAAEGVVEYAASETHGGRKHSLPKTEPARLVSVTAAEPLLGDRRIAGYRWTVRDVPDPAQSAAEPQTFTFEVGLELPPRLRRGNAPVRIDPRNVKPGMRLALVLGRGQVRDSEGHVVQAVDKVFTEAFFRPRKSERPKPQPKTSPKP